MKNLNERRYRVAQKAINKMEVVAKHLRSENDEVFLANGDTVTFPRDVIDFADWVTEKGEDVLTLTPKTLEARWIKFLGVLTGERAAYTPKKKAAAPSSPAPKKIKKAKIKKVAAKPEANPESPAPPPPVVKKAAKPKKLVKAAAPVAAAAPPAKPKKIRTRASKKPVAPVQESTPQGTVIPAAGIPMTLKAPAGVKMLFAPTHPIMANLVAAMMLLEAHLEKIQDKPAKADGRRIYNLINDACDKVSKMK